MEAKFFTGDDAAIKSKEFADAQNMVTVHLNELTPEERKFYKVSDYDTVKLNGVDVRPFYVAVPKSEVHPDHVVYVQGGTQISGPTGEQVQGMVDAAVKDALAKAAAGNQDAINKAVNDALAQMTAKMSGAAPKA